MRHIPLRRTPGVDRIQTCAAFDPVTRGTPEEATAALGEVARILGGVDPTDADALKAALEAVMGAAGITDPADSESPEDATDRALDREAARSVAQKEAREAAPPLPEPPRRRQSALGLTAQQLKLAKHYGLTPAEYAQLAAPRPRRAQPRIELTPQQIKIAREYGVTPAEYARVRRALRT